MFSKIAECSKIYKISIPLSILRDSTFFLDSVEDLADLEADDGLCGVMEANLGLASYWWILPFVQVSSDWWIAGHVTTCSSLIGPADRQD